MYSRTSHEKDAMILVVGVGLLVASGFGIVEGIEYFQVARNRVSETIRENIPLGVEVERMEVILNKLDEQVGRQKYELAKAQVALEDAEASLAGACDNCQKLLSDMRTLRDLQNQVPATVGACGMEARRGEHESQLRVSLESDNWRTDSRRHSHDSAPAASITPHLAFKDFAHSDKIRGFSPWSS